MNLPELKETITLLQCQIHEAFVYLENEAGTPNLDVFVTAGSLGYYQTCEGDRIRLKRLIAALQQGYDALYSNNPVNEEDLVILSDC